MTAPPMDKALMDKDNGRPGGLSSCGPSPSVSAVPASIPDAANLLRLLAAATPGEWDAVGRTVEARCVTSDAPEHGLHTMVAILGDDEYIHNARAEEDAALIAAMKAALPWYLEAHLALETADQMRAAPLLYVLMKIAKAFPDATSRHALALKKLASQAYTQAIEARRAETQSGSVEDESAVRQDAPESPHQGPR